MFIDSFVIHYMAEFTEKTDLLVLAKNLKKKVNGLLTVYGLLIVGTILLFLVVVGLCGLGAWGMWESGRIYGRAVILLIGAIVVAGICVKVVLGPLFKIFEKRKNNGKEIKRADYPELFKLIDEVVEKVDCLQPKHVYLSDECNAYVNYPSMWGYLFHGRQNLTIGIPLLFGMNKTEFKSILSHEFGHFTQKSVNVNRVANLSEFLCGAIAQSQEDMEKADDDSYEAKARLFARIATRIMLKQYHKVAPLNGVLSRAQEYDADRHSYEVVGTEGSLSSLCKIQDLASRWDSTFIPWLWDRISERRSPENVRELFRKFSGCIDSVARSELKPSVHYKASPGEFDSRLSAIENTDTHPSNNQRCLAIASYAPKKTDWDDAPAFDYFPDSAVSEMYNLVTVNLTKRRFPETTEFLKKDVQDSELLDQAAAITSPMLDSFYNDEIFYGSEILEAAEKNESEVEFPFTEQNADRLREYKTAKNDYATLQRIVDENSALRKYLYNGKEYSGTNVPISEHREYYAKKYDLAWAIALQCHCWMLQHVKDDEQMNRCFSDLIWIKRTEIRLGDGWDDMQTVYRIGQSHNTSTKAVEFVDSMERTFRDVASRFFEKNEDGVDLFSWMCAHLGTPDDEIKQAEDFMSRGHREYEQEFYEAYRTVGSVFAQHFNYNWDILKRNLIMPQLNKEVDK